MYAGRESRECSACRALCLLFVKIHAPVAVVVLWLTGIFALVSFAVVRRLCRDAVKDTPVSGPIAIQQADSSSQALLLLGKLPGLHCTP